MARALLHFIRNSYALRHAPGCRCQSIGSRSYGGSVMSIYGGIEAGGTKFVCAIGFDPQNLTTISFPTTTPDETIEQAITFFQEHLEREPLVAVGIGSFGPVDLNPTSHTFGYITTTPKPDWPYTDFAGRIARALDIPVAFDTDVNAAALGEAKWGAAQGLDTFVYLTVGTGIGGGVVINGKLLHGLLHPEIGHLRIQHDWKEDPYPGACPFHGDCLEGLSSGQALSERWRKPSEALPEDHSAWALEAKYLALGLVNLICTISPQRIILGGGVLQQRRLFPMIRRNVLKLLNGYLQIPAVINDIDNYILPPTLGNLAGVLGAIALAKEISK